MPPTEIELEGVRAHIGLKESISLKLCGPKLIGIIGPNGAGKSSLLRLLVGLNSSDTSRISVNRNRLDHLTGLERARQIAYLPQSPPLVGSLSVGELISQALYPYRSQSSLEFIERNIESILDRLGLDQFRSRLISTLSGGEIRRVMIARALAQHTSVILLDEPLANLDWAFQERLMRLFKEMKEQRSALVITTIHCINLAALYADELILVSEGEIISHGQPSQVMTPKLLSRAYGETPLLTTHPRLELPQRYPLGPD